MSADLFLGVPYNIAGYALLTHMVAHVVGMVPGEFIWEGGDTHIYTNHIEQFKELLTRKPYPSSILRIKRSVSDIDSFTFSDFELIGYKHHAAIKAPVAI